MTNKRRVLTIEDDRSIRRGLVDALRFAGYEVAEAGRGDDGLAEAFAGEYDMVLLDLVLPIRDGFEILTELREARPMLPIIILTARGAEGDRIRGLRGGADDYVAKPFSVEELLARVDAVLRRSPQRPMPLSAVSIPGGVIDFERREIRFTAGARETLSERESELLIYLARHRGRSVKRDEILAHVWKLKPEGINTRTIDMHVARIREKLHDATETPTILLTVRGKGYMFQMPGDQPEEHSCHG